MDNKSKHDEILARGRLNLQANQQGHMTPQQKDWLKRDMKQERQRQYQLVYVSCAVFFVVGIILVLIPFLPIPIIAVPIVWSIGVVHWFGFVWVQQKPIRDDLEAGTVNSVTGYVDKSSEHGYHVTIDGTNYATPPDLYMTFDETQRYIIYFIPESKVVLSAESVTESSDLDTEIGNQTKASNNLDEVRQ